MFFRQQKTLCLISVCFTFTIVLAGCDYRKGASVKDDVLVYCSEGSPETFNPQLSTSGTTFDASSRPIYNRLVEFKPGTTLIQPALATGWEISKDGREYIFYLRKNVKFHHNELFTPTRNFNADDVIFSFNRQRLVAHPFHKISSLAYGYFDSMELAGLVKNIIKLDDYKIKFELNQANSPFLSTLAMDFTSILSAEYANQLLAQARPELIDTQPIGTGPFRLVRYQPDAFIRYIAHADYWQGEQKLKHLVYAITPDPSLRYARLYAGECDVMANPLPVHVDAARNQSQMQVLTEPGLNLAYLTLNTLKPPFDNRLVRIALNHAVNKEAIINAVYQNTASLAKNPIPPSMWSYDNTTSDYQYDLDRAKRLLTQAGYPKGFEMNIWTMSAQRPYNPNAKKMAELIQQDLIEVGIRVTISTFEYGTFLAKTRKGEHHSALMGWISDNGDPDNFFTPLLSCSGTLSGTNTARWCDEEFNHLLSKARENNYLPSRQKLYKKAQHLFKSSSPWVPIAHATQHAIVRPRVKNFKMLASGGVSFKGVYLSQTPLEELAE